MLWLFDFTHSFNTAPTNPESTSKQEDDKAEISSSSSDDKLAKMDDANVDLLRTLDEEREKLNALVTSQMVEQEEQKSEGSIDMFDVDSEDSDQGTFSLIQFQC